jgi:hypothetical protein
MRPNVALYANLHIMFAWNRYQSLSGGSPGRRGRSGIVEEDQEGTISMCRLDD